MQPQPPLDSTPGKSSRIGSRLFAARCLCAGFPLRSQVAHSLPISDVRVGPRVDNDYVFSVFARVGESAAGHCRAHGRPGQPSRSNVRADGSDIPALS